MESSNKDNEPINAVKTQQESSRIASQIEVNCEGCGQLIVDRYYIVAVNKHWHSKCLKCTQCGMNLEAERSCFSCNDDILCRQDYIKRFSSLPRYRCVNCSQIIEPNQLVMKINQGCYYHLDCFNCSHCLSTLTKNDYFTFVGGKIYCQDDYHHAIQDWKTASSSQSTSSSSPSSSPSLPLEDTTSSVMRRHWQVSNRPSKKKLKAIKTIEDANQRQSEHSYENDGEYLDNELYKFHGFDDDTDVTTRNRYCPRGIKSEYDLNRIMTALPSTEFATQSTTVSPHLYVRDFDDKAMVSSRDSLEFQRSEVKGEGGGGYNLHLTSPGSSSCSESQTGSKRAKRKRTSFKHHQIRSMEQHFSLNHNPDSKELEQLSTRTGLPKRVLQVWFQNARAKWRKNLLRQQSLEPQIVQESKPLEELKDECHQHLISSSSSNACSNEAKDHLHHHHHQSTYPSSLSPQEEEESFFNNDSDSISPLPINHEEQTCYQNYLSDSLDQHPSYSEN